MKAYKINIKILMNIFHYINVSYEKFTWIKLIVVSSIKDIIKKYKCHINSYMKSIEHYKLNTVLDVNKGYYYYILNAILTRIGMYYI